MIILKLKDTNQYRTPLGDPVTVKEETVKQWQERGFIPADPQSPEELEHAILSRMTPGEIDHAIFMAGPRSLTAKVGRRVLDEKKLAEAKLDAELEAEKLAAHGITGESVPKPMGSGSGMSTSPVFSYNGWEEVKKS